MEPSPDQSEECARYCRKMALPFSMVYIQTDHYFENLEVFLVQQNSFNPVSIHLETLIILCLRRAVARQEILLFTPPPPKNVSSLKQADLWDMLKQVSKTVCTLTIIVSPDSLHPTPSTSSAIMLL